ncbi:transglutaminase domain-containing protein [Demequina sp.]|uniref:transglutaminase domain-containing protein n=1 Tax=Demequina sp. TaxID=2050685 RepID=UPI003A8915E2
MAVLLVCGYSYQWALSGGYVPSWATPAALTAAFGAPDAPSTDYPTYGSTDLVTYLEASMVEQRDAINVTYWSQNVGLDGVSDALLEAASQNPYVFVRGWSTLKTTATVTVQPEYIYDSGEADRRRTATRQAAADALVASGASAAVSDADKVTAIHDWIVSHATYDMGVFEAIEAGEESPRVDQSQEAYGILVMGTAVCNGYAMAFTAMAEQAGLDSVVVTGSDSAGLTGGSHAWNKVLVDGQWLLVDATWDDPIGGTEVYNDYLMLSPRDPQLATRTTDTDWVVDGNLGAFGA